MGEKTSESHKDKATLTAEIFDFYERNVTLHRPPQHKFIVKGFRDAQDNMYTAMESDELIEHILKNDKKVAEDLEPEDILTMIEAHFESMSWFSINMIDTTKVYTNKLIENLPDESSMSEDEKQEFIKQIGINVGAEFERAFTYFEDSTINTYFYELEADPPSDDIKHYGFQIFRHYLKSDNSSLVSDGLVVMKYEVMKDAEDYLITTTYTVNHTKDESSGIDDYVLRKRAITELMNDPHRDHLINLETDGHISHEYGILLTELTDVTYLKALLWLRSCSMFLEKGHTQEELDQANSRVCSIIDEIDSMVAGVKDPAARQLLAGIVADKKLHTESLVNNVNVITELQLFDIYDMNENDVAEMSKILSFVPLKINIVKSSI